MTPDQESKEMEKFEKVWEIKAMPWDGSHITSEKMWAIWGWLERAKKEEFNE